MLGITVSLNYALIRMIKAQSDRNCLPIYFYKEQSETNLLPAANYPPVSLHAVFSFIEF